MGLKSAHNHTAEQPIVDRADSYPSGGGENQCVTATALSNGAITFSWVATPLSKLSLKKNTTSKHVGEPKL
jgi:hypothetical protein